MQCMGCFRDLTHDFDDQRDMTAGTDRNLVSRRGGRHRRGRSFRPDLGVTNLGFLGVHLIARGRERFSPLGVVDFGGAAACQLIAHAREFRTFDELHRVEPLVVLRSGCEDFDDVGVFDPSQRANLPREPFVGLGVTSTEHAFESDLAA